MQPSAEFNNAHMILIRPEGTSGRLRRSDGFDRPCWYPVVHMGSHPPGRNFRAASTGFDQPCSCTWVLIRPEGGGFDRLRRSGGFERLLMVSLRAHGFSSARKELPGGFDRLRRSGGFDRLLLVSRRAHGFSSARKELPGGFDRLRRSSTGFAGRTDSIGSCWSPVVHMGSHPPGRNFRAASTGFAGRADSIGSCWSPVVQMGSSGRLRPALLASNVH